MEKFRWCFIGTGYLANNVARMILASGNHEIVSCYSRNIKAANEFASKYDSKAYETAIEAINDPNVDGVYIVTPHNTHFKFAKMALEVHKPVLLEKPFTVFAKETEELIRLAKENNTYICEAMWTWFASPANQVKKWLSENIIGDVTSADFTYFMQKGRFAPRVADPLRAGGALLDITIYPITYAYVLWGYPTSIKATGIIENGIDVEEHIELTFKNGLTATIGGGLIDGTHDEVMKIVGNKGNITVPMYHCNSEVSLNDDGHISFVDGHLNFIGYLPEFDSVANEIKNGYKESNVISFKHTLDIMKILDEVRNQIGLDYKNLED